jgi:hypothetical protein
LIDVGQITRQHIPVRNVECSNRENRHHQHGDGQ